jgi:hypothetical protein
MTKIINCTPHDINVAGTIFPKSGIIPRVDTIETPADDIFMCSQHCEKGNAGKCGFISPEFFCERFCFQTITSKKTEVTGLPDPEENTFFIVSAMVFDSTSRTDVVAPDTGKTAIRNDKGQIESVIRFIRK